MAAVVANDAIQAQEREDVDILAEKATVEETSRAPSTRAASLKDEEPAVKPNGSVKAEKPVAASFPPSATGPVQVPFPHPLSHCKPTPRPALTPDHQKKYDELLKVVEGWTEVPKTSHKHSEKEPLTDDDRLWLTKECLLRYLRATSWHSVDAAAKRLMHTLTWRREYGLHKFTPEYISPEAETGKQVILGYDNEARPCLYMNPGKQNTAQSDRQLHHLVYMLESLIDLMVPGQETNALIINYKESSSSKNPSVGQGRATLTILQGHYPERLGRALISGSKCLSWLQLVLIRPKSCS
jgi:CRAL/TRIO domain/CRAL/TRIO, N-terminal domain